MIRYWSFTRMLQKPARSPLSFSSRLPGGDARSVTSWATLIQSSFRCVTGQIVRGTFRAAFDATPSKMSAVVWSPKLTIIAGEDNGYPDARQACNADRQPRGRGTRAPRLPPQP